MATVVAFISTDTTDAKDLLDDMSNQCYYRSDNASMASSKASLFDGSISVPLDKDVDGNTVQTSDSWTGAL